MGLLDFFKHHGEQKVTYNGLTFWAPKPLTNEAYQKKRKAEVKRLECQYDLSTIDGINAIPVPMRKETSPGGGVQSVTDKIEYNLLLRAGQFEKAGDVDMALACLRKANQIMPMSCVEYGREPYMRLPRYLRKLRRFDEARAAEIEINKLFASGHVVDFGGDDAQKARNRADYDWLWEFIPELCPKSFSGYMRIKNAKSDKCKRIVLEAKNRGRVIE